MTTDQWHSIIGDLARATWNGDIREETYLAIAELAPKGDLSPAVINVASYCDERRDRLNTIDNVKYYNYETCQYEWE